MILGIRNDRHSIRNYCDVDELGVMDSLKGYIMNNKESKVSNDKEMWNGGTTNEYNELIRASEDYYDIVDSEIEFREELVKRERLMREESKNQKIESKYRLTQNQINQNMDKPCEVSGGDPKNRYRRPEGNNEQ